MSVTTSARLNADQLRAALPPDAGFQSSGGDLASSDLKAITFVGVDDATGQAAISAAAGQFTDRAGNLAALQASAQTALTTNATFLGTVAARRTAIANGKSTAQTGTTASVTSVAQAQTQIRSIWSTLVQIATALDDLNNDAESITKQSNGVIRLLLGALDSTAGT